DAGAQLRIRRLFAAGALASPLAAHGSHKAALLNVRALNGQIIAALEAGIRKLSQGLIEEEADVRRGDLVGRDVIAQFGILLRITGVPRQILPGKLTPNQLRVFGEKEDTSRKPNLAGT